jgi:hypothetical protein
MKKALIILTSIAVVLGIITFFVVFYGGGTYVVNSPLPSDSTYSSSTIPSSTIMALGSSTASSTASGTLALASSTGSSTISAAGGNNDDPQEYATDFTESPVAWAEGNETISITGATLTGSQITLKLSVAMGDVPECVPLNVRFVADENGDLTAPLNSQFTFPESGTCEGAPGATYGDQEIVFTVDTTNMPLVFTSGGSSNVYFEIATSSPSGITVSLPPSAG